MCTLIALHRCIDGVPLVIAANRDEFVDRAAEGPSLRDEAGVRIVAPRDVRAGGTWLGVNAHGVFAALTNRRSVEPDPARRSRGLLVLDALASESAAASADAAARLPADAYNPFNLLVADADSAHVVSYDGKPERIDLEPGAHVVGNVHPNDRSGKLARLRAEAERVAAAAPATLFAQLAAICRSHEGDAELDRACVHAGSYGTRSATLLSVGSASGDTLLYADGAPCKHGFRDFTPLLVELGRGREPGRTDVRNIR
jgi:uncharacterized protein with NRDE domain